MEREFGQANPDVVRYAYDEFQPEDSILSHAREHARQKGLPEIEVGAFDARHLEVFVRMLNVGKAVEIGTLGGYSAITIARGMRPGGKLHTFELDPHHAEVAKQNIAQARLLADVVVHVGPAMENLPSVAHEAPFDLVFIDADKGNYPKYLAWATDHLKVGGAVIADNTFAWGRIHRHYDLSPGEARAVSALREFNHIVAHSGRFRSTILPTGEGMTIAIKVN